MNKQDKDKFGELMDGVCEMYGKEPSVVLYRMYFEALAEYSVGDVISAISAHTRDTKAGAFFPKPGDIIRHLNSGKSTVQINNEKARMKWLERKNVELSTGIPAYTKDEITRAEIGVA